MDATGTYNKNLKLFTTYISPVITYFSFSGGTFLLRDTSNVSTHFKVQVSTTGINDLNELLNP